MFKISQQALVSSVPAIVGTIVPYAGSVVPNGWLLCDGSELRISDYLTLYNTIPNPLKDLPCYKW